MPRDRSPAAEVKRPGRRTPPGLQAVGDALDGRRPALEPAADQAPVRRRADRLTQRRLAHRDPNRTGDSVIRTSSETRWHRRVTQPVPSILAIRAVGLILRRGSQIGIWLLEQRASGVRVRAGDLAGEVGLRLDQVLDPLLLGRARDLELEARSRGRRPSRRSRGTGCPPCGSRRRTARRPRSHARKRRRSTGRCACSGWLPWLLLSFSGAVY